jgi:RHS repeat-associated protein
VTGIGIGFNVDDQGAVSGYYDTYSLDRPTWRYYHDGQAPFEDDKTHDPGEGTRKDVTRYALGARGGDMAETVLAMGSSGERTVRSYPLCDGHGNTVAQVARAEDGAPDASFAPVPGAPAFELGARRKYDAWGQVRWSEGAPLDQGYCGSLQRRRDAESGLVYMRARYYEPWTGRFLSEDPAMDGANWYVYASNCPTMMNDPTGEASFLAGLLVAALVAAAINIAGQLLLYGTVEGHLVISAATWGAIGASWGKALAKAAGAKSSSILGALLSSDRGEFGKWIRAKAASTYASGSGRTLNNQLVPAKDRELSGLLGKVVDAHIGNNAVIQFLIDLGGFDN